MEINKVLVVDDEEDIRAVVQLSLSHVGGWKTALASSCAEALEKAVTERPDIIILDVMMPELDGVDTLKRLQQNEQTQRIPVIFMTARAQEVESERLLDLGAVGVVAKPFDPMTLPNQIREIAANISR